MQWLHEMFTNKMIRGTQEDTGLGGERVRNTEGAPHNSFSAIKNIFCKIADTTKPHHIFDKLVSC